MWFSWQVGQHCAEKEQRGDSCQICSKPWDSPSSIMGICPACSGAASPAWEDSFCWVHHFPSQLTKEVLKGQAAASDSVTEAGELPCGNKYFKGVCQPHPRGPEYLRRGCVLQMLGTPGMLFPSTRYKAAFLERIWDKCKSWHKGAIQKRMKRVYMHQKERVIANWKKQIKEQYMY